MLLKQRWQNTCASYGGPQSFKNEDWGDSHRSYQLVKRECSAEQAFWLTLIVDVAEPCEIAKDGSQYNPSAYSLLAK